MHLRNVLVINAHSCRNAGDMALLQVAIDQIRRLGKVDNIIISLDDLDYYPGRERIVGSLFTWIKQGGRWHINRLLYLSVSAIASILSYRYLKHTLFF
ncbi:hypothetical protein, partial [Thermanaerothrix sp.]|uniref:hypothetical protein n=1 Tax=Thermanaerothrix sp. TaxID=2972675 RepID=UPI003C7DE595